MASITQIIILVLVSNYVSSSLKIKTMIKDPIDVYKLCNSVNVEWVEDKLVTVNGSSGMIFCKSTGYIGLVHIEDKLSKAEIKSIRLFLQQAKKILRVQNEFNFIEMGYIDNLWLIKNIYERRDLSPKQHITIMNKLKEISFKLTEEIIIEKESLRNECLGKNKEDQWCRAFTLNNKLWEEYHNKQVNKANKEDKSRYTQDKILSKTKEQERKGTPSLCKDFNLAQQLSLQIMQTQLKGKVKFKEISYTELNGGEKFSFTYVRVTETKITEDKWWEVHINKKSCKSDFLKGR